MFDHLKREAELLTKTPKMDKNSCLLFFSHFFMKKFALLSLSVLTLAACSAAPAPQGDDAMSSSSAMTDDSAMSSSAM